MPRTRNNPAKKASLSSSSQINLCICCSGSLGSSENDYQKVFDETGIEIDLKNLLQKCFQLEIEEDKRELQAVCGGCLDDLIEVYDIINKSEQDENALQTFRDSAGDDEEHCSADPTNIKIERCDWKVERFCGEDQLEAEVLDGFRDITQSFGQTQIKAERNEYDIDEIENDMDDDERLEGNFAVKIERLADSEDENMENYNNLEDDNRKEVDNKDEHEQEDFDETTIQIENNDGITEEYDEENEKSAVEESETSQENVEQNDDQNDEQLDVLEQNFNFRAYKESALRSKFDDICFPEGISCRICSEKLERHVSIIDHVREKHSVEDFAYPCIIDSNCEPMKTSADLSFHLIFNHYDLAKLTIYAQCPECLRRFNDFLTYNKHACFIGKNISRGVTECEKCGKHFRSNKRYRFHLQFHMEKHRPMACLICDKIFTDENKFFEHIQYGHERDLGFTCIMCDRIFCNEINLKNHLKIHKIVRPFKCRLCSKSYLYKQLLKDHMLAHHSKKSPFQCHICDKYLNKQTLLNKHIMSHKQPESKEVLYCTLCGLVPENDQEAEEHFAEHEKMDELASTELITIDIAYCCEYCELAYKDQESLRIHRDNHDKQRYFCHICPMAYDEFKKLKTHKLTHFDYVDKRKTFPVMRHYICDYPQCDKSYMQWPSLRSHKRHKHAIKERISCDICPETFKNPLRLQTHMDTVHEGSNYNCQFCEKSYVSKMALSVHVARMHNTTKVKCDICENTFSNQFYLLKHKASYHSTHKCDVCNKLMKNAKNLVVHQRMVHGKEKRFFCKYCNKGYYNNCDRLEHEESVHQKLKKFKCEICPYAAVYKQSLTIHMRAHRNETPYKCSICTKGFRRSYALSLHLRRHNNIRDFVCPYQGCGSAYPNQGILNSHLRIKHANGANERGRKRRTLGNDEKNEQPARSRRKYNVPVSTVFIDDDDGLDDGVIGDPTQSNENVVVSAMQELLEEENADDPVNSIINENREYAPAVIVQKNESDHDYIVRPDDDKIYGNVIEEYEIS